jgi:hypothetical protein
MQDITVAELDHQVQAWAQRLAAGDPPTAADYLAIGRLWNTIQATPALQAAPARRDFVDLVTQHIQTMAAALNMTAGRGFALTSTDHDFVLGGVLDERHRYRVVDLPITP